MTDCLHRHEQYAESIDAKVCTDCGHIRFLKRGKFHSNRKTVDGITFQSEKEADRWMVLRDMERCGEISELRRQVPFPIQVGCTVVCTYIADAVYLRDGQRTVEDSKGFATPVYKLKKRLMRAVYGIEVVET